MLDIGWSKILILAMVVLVAVPSKDLPALMRQIGKFVANLRRQAEEFRGQFREAIRDTELEQIHKDVEGLRRTTAEGMRDLQRSFDDEVKPIEASLNEPLLTSSPSATSPAPEPVATTGAAAALAAVMSEQAALAPAAASGESAAAATTELERASPAVAAAVAAAKAGAEAA